MKYNWQHYAKIKDKLKKKQEMHVYSYMVVHFRMVL